MMGGMNSTIGFDRFASQFRRLDTLTASCAATCRCTSFSARRRAEKVISDGLQLLLVEALQKSRD